jgi:hypothetical protein
MCFDKPENLNAAFDRGFQVRLVPGPKHAAIQTYEEMRGLGMRGDTVDVVLDLSSASPVPVGPHSPDSAFNTRVMQDVFNYLVEQTFSCILLNARRRWPEVKPVSVLFLRWRPWGAAACSCRARRQQRQVLVEPRSPPGQRWLQAC